MKNLIVIVFVILFLSSSGQSNILDIGVEGGITSASLRGNELIEDLYKSRSGYSAGLFVQYNFSNLFSLRTGAYIERKGASADVQLTDEFGNPTSIAELLYNFDYLSVPVLLRAGVGDKFRCFVNAGPYIGFLLKESTDWDELPEIIEENTSAYKKTEFGISVGAGFSYNLLQRIAISAEVRNNYGISDVNKSDIYFNGLPIKTNALNFLIGVAFKIG